MARVDGVVRAKTISTPRRATIWQVYHSYMSKCICVVVEGFAGVVRTRMNYCDTTRRYGWLTKYRRESTKSEALHVHTLHVIFGGAPRHDHAKCVHEAKVYTWKYTRNYL